jgi:hypothetical protein
MEPAVGGRPWSLWIPSRKPRPEAVANGRRVPARPAGPFDSPVMAAGVARRSGALARRAGRHALAAGLGLAVLAAPGLAPAQELWTFTPSLKVAEEYTDNVFGTAHDRQSDFITKITPGIALLYDARTLKLGLDYFATLELYADNSNLDNFGENQRGSVRFEYRPEERLGFHLTGYYARTNDPSTFLVPTTAPPPGATVVPTVETTRSETTQVTLAAGVDYQFTPRLTGRAGYDFIFLHQEGTDDGYTNTGTVGASYQLSSQDNAFTTLSGSVLDSTDTVTSASLLLGWGRRWTELFTTSIALGPRVTDGSWGGAANASAVYQAGHQWSFALAYSLGTALAAGTTGAQNVSALYGTIAYQATRDLGFTANGGWTRTWALDGDSGETENTYGAGLTASYRLTAWLALTLSYRFAIEDPDQGDSIRTNTVILGLTAAYPLPLR